MKQRSPPGAWRLLLPALVVWAVTAWAVTGAGSGIWVAACAGLLGFGISVRAIVRCRRVGRRGAVRDADRGTTGALLVLCAALLVVGVQVASAQHARDAPLLAGATERGDVVEMDTVLVAFPETRASDFGERHWVRAEAFAPRGRVPVLLWLPDPPPRDWAPGLRVAVLGVPERFAPESSAAYGLSVLRVSAQQSGAWGERLGAFAAGLRAGLRTAAMRMPGTELVPGFAVGDTSLVPDALDRAMRTSSLSHLTAVSGANCALVTGAMIWLLARLGVGRRARALAAGAALAAFVGIVGPDASVQRAAVMAAVLLLSAFGGKRASALPALGLAILVLLMLDPWQALQPGFALSIAATGGILLAATPLSGWLRRRLRLPGALALPVAVAVTAQLACGPLLLLLQPGIPAVGVLANVIAAPAAPIGTGLGLIAALLTPMSPDVAGVALALAGLAGRWVAATAELTASLPLSRWHWPGGAGGALALAGVQLSLLVALALHRGWLMLPGETGERVRRPWHADPPAPPVVRQAIQALIGTSLGVAIALTLTVPAAEQLGVPNGWAVVACDVGQGDAMLIRDPTAPQEVMLVDTGDDPGLLRACMDRFGVDGVSLLVLSHDDRDHVGALAEIVDRVDAALIAPESRDQLGRTREVVDLLERARVPFQVAVAGDRSPAAGSSSQLHWEVLAPVAGRRPPDTNAASLVMRVFAGATTVLLLGDTGADEQRALIRRGVDLRADVVKVAHHGSRDQDPDLPVAVGAQWALVSVGAGNRHGHPAQETLAALVRAEHRVLRTDRHGSIALVPGAGGELEPWVERTGGDAIADIEGLTGGNGARSADRVSAARPKLDAWRQARRRSRGSATTRRAPLPSC